MAIRHESNAYTTTQYRNYNIMIYIIAKLKVRDIFYYSKLL